MHKLKVIPLGGLEEVGKNMTVIEYGNELFIIDAGIVFPDGNMHGVDVVIPDFDYLRANKQKIKGLFITHGHEDHIGSISYFLKEFPQVPLYATQLTAALITSKLGYAKVTAKKLQIIKDEQMKLQYNHCSISFFRTQHSIPDSVGVVIETPVGNVVHTGDFRIDYEPADGKRMDFKRLSEIRDKGVLFLLSDSTNAEKPGVTPSEGVVKQHLDNYFSQATGRIIAATFASSLHRISNLIKLAEEKGRRVVLVGKRMEKNVQTCLQLGYLSCKDETFISVRDMKKYKPHQILILTTGAQGEVLAGLNRLGMGENKEVQLMLDDTVILSSGVIPGNERLVGNLVNTLLKRGITVIQDKNIHTSGHAYQDEQMLMLSLLSPKYFIPCHGEYRMLLKHKKLAEKVGMSSDNIFLCENGDVISYDGETAVKEEKVQAGAVLIDNSGMGEVSVNVMRDRSRMAEQGVFSIFVRVKTDVRKVEIIFDFKGIVCRVNRAILNKDLVEAVEKRLNNKDKSGSLKKELIKDFTDVLYKHTNRRPLIMIPSITFEKSQSQKEKGE